MGGWGLPPGWAGRRDVLSFHVSQQESCFPWSLYSSRDLFFFIFYLLTKLFKRKTDRDEAGCGPRGFCSAPWLERHADSAALCGLLGRAAALLPASGSANCWELWSCVTKKKIGFLLPLLTPSLGNSCAFPFCRCRCSRQYHRCTCVCLYLRVQESHVILKKKYKKKKNTKNIQKKNIFFRPEFSTGINEYFS